MKDLNGEISRLGALDFASSGLMSFNSSKELVFSRDKPADSESNEWLDNGLIDNF